MALEHALLVSLSEKPASGLELTRRFDRSIGFFWKATHQQIYRVLGRMEADGWVTSATVPQPGRPAKKEYRVATPGRRHLATWLDTATALEPLRSEVAVKIRGAEYGDRAAVLSHVHHTLAAHRTLLTAYDALMVRDYPHPDRLTGQDLDHYHLLRGGILAEQTAITWLGDYLADHERQR